MAENSAQEMDGGFDLEAALQASLSEIETRDEPEEPVAEPQEAAPVAEETEAEPPKADRARGADGKFVKAEPAAEVEPVETAPEQPAEPPSEDIRRVANRLGLRRDEMDAFAKADPVLRDAFQRRSDEWHQSMEQMRPMAQWAQQVYQAMAPYEATIRASGMDHGQAAARLFQADHSLRYGSPGEKVNMLLSIARDYGIDLPTAAQYAAQGQQAYVDPNAVQARQLAEQAARQAAEANQRAQQWEQQQTQQQLSSEIQQFRANPEHKYFDQVRPIMADLIEKGQATSFKQAYDQAIWLDPTVRDQLIAERQAAAEQKTQAERARLTQEARRKSRINVAQRPTVETGEQPTGTWEENLAKYAEQISSD